MLVFCSWCGSYLGEKEPFWDRSIYHDICEECYKIYEEDEEEQVEMNERE